MPPLTKVLILAVIQGVTEFLPISSSGHLVMAKHALSLDSPGILLEVALHTGTLFSILFYYRKRILELFKNGISGQGGARLYIAALIIATIPVGLAYVLVKDQFEAAFGSPVHAAIFLCVTGVILLSLRLRRADQQELTVGRASSVGLVQAFALLPGVSRSGTTIAIGRHLGFSPERAAEFSMLLAIPALGGATLIKGIDIVKSPDLGDLTMPIIGLGVLVSAGIGYLALKFLVRTLRAGKFWLFGFYCLGVGALYLALGSR